MEIKIINLDTGEQTLKNHRKLVKKLVEKNRITREMRDHMFKNPQDLLRKLNQIRFKNSRYEEA